MDSIDFENDNCIICKTHPLNLNRNIKNISLILIYHVSYQVIEIKIFENFTNKLIGREIFTYTDIFGIFENYFLCFNEDMLNIYTSLNNSFLLKKYQANVNENTKQINIELLILKERELHMKTLNITTCQDEEGYEKVLDKIKELNNIMNNNIKNYPVAPVNYIKYENDLYCLYFEVFIEKEIDVLGIKTQVSYKSGENNINDLNIKQGDFYAVYYSPDEIKNISKYYYQSLLNLEEISKEIAISLQNKNIKLEGITKEKMKLKMKCVSSAMIKSDFDIILFKNKDIKEKYIDIIKVLKFKNEYLIKREIFQDKKQPKKNNPNVFYDLSPSNDSNNLNIGNITNISNASSEKKFIGKKKKRNETAKNKNSKIGKKNNPNKNEVKEDNNQKIKEPDCLRLKENEDMNGYNYNELYQQLIQHERERLATISEEYNECDH